VCQSVCWPVDRARAFFGQYGIPADQIQGNYETAQESQGLETEARRGPDRPADLFRFLELWVVPGRRLYYRPAHVKEWLLKTEWPYDLDYPSFVPLSFNRQFLRLGDAFPTRHVVEGLRGTFEKVIEFCRRDLLKALASKIFVNKGAWTPEVEKALGSAKSLEIIPMELPPGTTIKDVLVQQTFQAGLKDAIELAETLKKLHDEISGQDELVRGGETPGGMTATEATVRDVNSKLKLQDHQKRLDAALTDVLRQQARIAVQLMDPQRVAELAGPLAGLMWSLYGGRLDEYSVSVAAGSTGDRDTQQRLGRLNQVMQRGAALNAAYGAPIVKLGELFREFLRLNKIRRPERFLNSELLRAAETPPVGPATASAPLAVGPVAPAALPPPVEGAGVPGGETAAEAGPGGPTPVAAAMGAVV
jgi:hypothetical protein